MMKYEKEFTNDEPVNFKGLMIYPVKMRDYFKYNICSQVLDIDKNSIPDEKVISMSYLDFLIYTISSKAEEGISISYALYEILKLCLKENEIDIYYGKNEKGKSYIKIKDVEITKKDFDELRYLILHQNVPNYNDEHINPELAKELAKKKELESKGKHSVSLEKQIMSVVIGSSLSLEEVLDLSIRKFFIVMEMIDKKLNYIMYKQASLSGMVEFSNEIEHYLTEVESNGIDNEVMDFNSFKNKIESGNA